LEVACLGDVECQRITGLRYQLGIGFSIDLVESYAWYNIGASAGDEQSAKSRESVATSFSVEQLVAAQKRSREILKEIEAKKAKK
jgi:TPR repeat protein